MGTKLLLTQWFSKLNMHPNYMEALLKQTVGPGSVSQSVQMYISNKFPHDAVAAGPETTLGGPIT